MTISYIFPTCCSLSSPFFEPTAADNSAAMAFGAFFTFFLFPAAPPWLASQNHFIQPITRISSDVWGGLGLQDFPSVYNHIAPNPVAAIPSLHAAWAVLFCVFIYKLYGRRWGVASAIYPLLIFIGTVYEGEHYVFDVLLGIVYAVIGYLITPAILRFAKGLARKITRRTRQLKLAQKSVK